MDLGSKLKRIVSQTEQKAKKPSVSIDEVIEGDWIEISTKKVFSKTTWRTWNRKNTNLKKLLQISSGIQDDIKINDVLFLDTETTGLAGGTGTYAFMVGLGFLSDAKFQTVQLFMPGFSDEPALLEALNSFVEQFKCIASFNGKTFDIPLLQTRCSMTRKNDPFVKKPHIDLLHFSRAIWKKRLNSCSLQSIEANIFNQVREDDIPGELIPEIYFNFIREGDASQIAKIFYHNELDIVSMMSLIEVVDSMFENPDSGHFNDPIEQLCVGKYLSNKGYFEDGLTYYHRAKDTLNKSMRDEASIALGSLCKKIGNFEDAMSHFNDVETIKKHKVTALIEQAKHFEHKTKDYPKALEITTKALGLVREIENLDGDLQHAEETKTALLQRQNRLQRKLNK